MNTWILDTAIARLLSTNAPGSRNVIERISSQQSTRAIGRYIGQNELKPVAGWPPSFVYDKDVIAKIAQSRIPPSS